MRHFRKNYGGKNTQPKKQINICKNFTKIKVNCDLVKKPTENNLLYDYIKLKL